MRSRLFSAPAAWTFFGVCINGSIALQKGETRRAFGGTAGTNTNPRRKTAAALDWFGKKSKQQKASLQSGLLKRVVIHF
jgi:hypothetical protein